MVAADRPMAEAKAELKSSMSASLFRKKTGLGSISRSARCGRSMVRAGTLDLTKWRAGRCSPRTKRMAAKAKTPATTTRPKMVMVPLSPKAREKMSMSVNKTRIKRTQISIKAVTADSNRAHISVTGLLRASGRGITPACIAPCLMGISQAF